MRKSLPYIIILASILWLGNIFPANAAEVCTIKSATFSPSGAQNASWYTDARPPKVTLTITGENCAGKTVEVSITEDDTILSNDDDIAQLDNKPFIFPSTGNSFSVNLSAGETDCSDYLNAGGKDCDYFISVYKAAGGTFTSSGKPSGNLTYDCDNLCDKSWSLWASGSNNPPPLNPAGGNTSTSTYNLLAPLPGSNGQLVKTVDVSGSNALADYINTIIRLTIGLAAVLAVLMIIMGGLEYITSELPGAKGEGKQKITNAVVGLLVALGAWVLLYTINPKLVETDLSNLQTTTIQYIDGPDAGDDTIDPDFQKKELTYSTTTTVSPGVSAAVLKLKQGWQISQFHIFSNKRMLIQLTNGSQTDNSNIIDIGIGLNGFAKAGTAKTSDKKTPSGSWKIIDIRHVPGKAQFNKKGSNMGAAFWHLDPMTSGERGIGMHGNKSGTISSTNGCIRLRNADLLALQPYIKTGIPVYID